MIRGVPELYDGGYWYVVPLIGSGAGDDPIRPDIPGGAWCAWFSIGDAVATVRTPAPVEAGSLGLAAVKPHGRIGGR